MEKISFFGNKNAPKNILCLGAHCDDIEIGCGGTMLRLLQENSRVSVNWIVFSSNAEREIEAKKSSKKFLQRAKINDVRINKFRNGYFPYIGLEIKEYFEKLKQNISPDIIFTHYQNDLHQDHRIISELTWNTFRNHFILEYEMPKYDGDLGCPNFFVTLPEDIKQKKINHILDCFSSQRDKHWFDDKTFESIMRLRGVESCAPDGYAEGYYCRKIVF